MYGISGTGSILSGDQVRVFADAQTERIASQSVSKLPETGCREEREARPC